jgi:hypothetical protein
MKNRYSINSSVSYLPDLAPFILAQFRDSIETETGLNFKCWGDEFPAKMSVERLIEVIHEAITESVDTKVEDIRRMDLGSSVIELTASSESLGDEPLVVLKVFLSLNEDQEDYYDETETIVGEAIIAKIEAAGEAESLDGFVKSFKSLLKTVHDESRTSMIRWIFDSGHGHSDRTFQITKEWDIDRIYYPWIDTELKAYYKAFLDSRAQIMVAFGPPGTGKTSFIRDLICEMNLNAFISYDMKVLTSDSTFVRYLTDSIFDAIIIEDADELLTSERGDSNKIIAKILNISDGLIKLPKKKLIFTTNLPKVEDIDPAIIRPGRCFDVMEFRQLDKAEATAVCVKLGIDLPAKKSEKYSLAELFYERELKTSTDPFTTHHADKLKKRTMGFV